MIKWNKFIIFLILLQMWNENLDVRTIKWDLGIAPFLLIKKFFLNRTQEILKKTPLPKNTNLTIEYQWPIMLELWWDINDAQNEIIILKSSDLENFDPNVPYIIIQPNVFYPSNWSSWFKWLREYERVNLWFWYWRFDFWKYVSRNHITISLEQWKIKIIDTSKNWTYMSESWNIVEVSQKKSGENSDYFTELWPNWFDFLMRQWPVWNCYFVAALNAIKENPNAQNYLKELIRPNGKWWWIVSFKWTWQETEIKIEDIYEMQWNTLYWQLWDKILERAYLRLRHDRANPILRWWILFKDWWTALPWYDGNFAHEWGHIEEVFYNFFWDKIKNLILELFYGDELYAYSIKYLKENINGKELLTLSTPSIKSVYEFWKLHIYFPNKTIWEREEIYNNVKYKWDKVLFQVEDINWVIRDFNFQHAYSIWKYNLEKWWMEIINPHNTGDKRYKISLENIFKYFWDMVITSFIN